MSSSRSSTTPSDRRRAVARILGPKGLRGGVRVELLTDWPERLTPGTEIWLDGDPVARTIEATEAGGKVPVMYLSGISSREDADRLVGRYLEAATHPLAADEYFWDDLVGLHAESPAGTPIGELVEVFRAGGNEVYRVVGPTGERLVPALRSMVERIDLEQRIIVIAADDAEEVR
jgi:16S rRNA processing protein RimM